MQWRQVPDHPDRDNRAHAGRDAGSYANPDTGAPSHTDAGTGANSGTCSNAIDNFGDRPMGGREH